MKKYFVTITQNDKCAPDRSSENDSFGNRSNALNYFNTLAAKYQCTTPDRRADAAWTKRMYGLKYSVELTTQIV